jgi:hypothetical protein
MSLWRIMEKTVPQRLKPIHLANSYGTAEAVPSSFYIFNTIFCSRLQLVPCQSVPAPDFSPGERVFKPARMLYLALTGLLALV